MILGCLAAVCHLAAWPYFSCVNMDLLLIIMFEPVALFFFVQYLAWVISMGFLLHSSSAGMIAFMMSQGQTAFFLLPSDALFLGEQEKSERVPNPRLRSGK